MSVDAIRFMQFYWKIDLTFKMISVPNVLSQHVGVYGFNTSALHCNLDKCIEVEDRSESILLKNKRQRSSNFDFSNLGLQLCSFLGHSSRHLRPNTLNSSVLIEQANDVAMLDAS